MFTTHYVAEVADARRIIGFYRLRWTIEQLFRTMKTKGFDFEALRQEQNGPLEMLVTAILIAAVKVMQRVAERDGEAETPARRHLRPRRSANLGARPSKPRRQNGKTKEPASPRVTRLGRMGLRKTERMTGYYRKGGPHRHAQKPHTIPRHQARLEPPKCVNPVGSSPRTRLGVKLASRSRSFSPKDGTPYQDLGADHFDTRHKTASTRRLVQRLQNLGFAVQFTPAPA